MLVFWNSRKSSMPLNKDLQSIQQFKSWQALLLCFGIVFTIVGCVATSFYTYDKYGGKITSAIKSYRTKSTYFHSL